MAELNPWKKKELRLTYGELEGAHAAMQGLLDGDYKVGSNIFTRSLNKARANIQIGSIKRALRDHPIDDASPKLVITIYANPAVARFYTNTVNAAIDHYATTPISEEVSGDPEQMEEINVLRGLQQALNRSD